MSAISQIGTILLLIIASSVPVVISILFLQWILKMENIKCSCSVDWKREYIKHYIFLYLFALGVNLLSNIYNIINNKNPNVLLHYFNVLMGLLTIINIIISIIYINELKNNRCLCSEDIRREIYYYFNIIELSIQIFLIFIMFIFMIMLFILGRK